MPTDIIEMLWGCLLCKSENKGRDKTCKNCGKFRTADSPEWLPGDISPMAAVKDPELLKKAKAGPDWTCKFCSSSQFRADGNCARCGSDQTTSTGEPKWATEWAQNILNEKDPREDIENFQDRFEVENDPSAAWRQAKDQEYKERFEKSRAKVVPLRDARSSPAEILAASVPAPNLPPFDSEPEPFVTTGSYREAPKKRVPPPPPFDWRGTAKKYRKFAIGTAFVALVGSVLFLLFRTRILDAQVSSVAWSKTVEVDRYTTYRREGWTVDNGGFDVTDEGSRFHHYEHRLVGMHTESYTESYPCGETCITIPGTCTTTPRTCTSNKNGFATCTGGDRICSPSTRSCTPKTCTRPATRQVPDYQDVPHYQEWYSWSVWAWGHNRVVNESGTTGKPSWPSREKVALGANLRPGEDERVASQKESFDVTMRSGKEFYTYHPKSDAEFEKFAPGSQHKIKVSVALGVEVLR